MSAQPPPYQNHPPQQPYGGYPQPQPGPQGPQRPQRPQTHPVQGLLAALVVLALFGGGAWYVYDYNTNPNGGKAKEQAAVDAQNEKDKKHEPEVGDCVKIQDPEGEPLPTIVDCGSAEAEYKTGDMLYGPDMECGSKFDYGIQYHSSRGGDHTLCFNKV
ncbi:hypothetical protein J7I98_12730 [Streptomyces sp. ISL-98]|uniref:LppU/SCO3897 family protein n=1 Tax=Streptomyces sp. ISL-98 TaxID=2819192 RepID=UPI001BEA3E3C|nr:hypothetical protein [Streptomyces sp. ISL-98]MBT2506739.1 hypothetical protein [Streptomyces sp. ISL-98]